MNKLYEHYVFSKDILDRVIACRKTDNVHSLAELAEDWGVIAASIAGSLWTWHHAAFGIGFVVYLFAVFLIGGRQRALVDILHQASHRTFMRKKWFNDILGTFCSGYLVLHSLSVYQASHIRHHKWFAHPVMDPDYAHYQRIGVCGAKKTAGSVRRYLCHLYTPRMTWDYLTYVLINRIWSKDENKRERIIRLAFIGSLIAGFVVTGKELFLLAYWIIPLITTHVWIGSLMELLEHYPMIECGQRVDIFMARNRHGGAISNFLLGSSRYEGYHLIHHLFPSVPEWMYGKVHEICMEDSVYASLNRTKGWRVMIRDLLAA